MGVKKSHRLIFFPRMKSCLRIAICFLKNATVCQDIANDIFMDNDRR